MLLGQEESDELQLVAQSSCVLLFNSGVDDKVIYAEGIEQKKEVASLNLGSSPFIRLLSVYFAGLGLGL